MATTEEIGSHLPLPRSPLTGPDVEGFLPWLNLPNELKIKIMRQFVPSSISCTDYKGSRLGPIPRLDNEPWASRQTLTAACLASRQLQIICSPLLYEAVALRKPEEVMCFLRSMMENPELRTRVRRLAWVRLARRSKAKQPSSEETPRTGRLVVGAPSSWPSSGPDRKLAEMFQLYARDSTATLYQKAFGVILAMLPRIEVLFLTHESSEIGFLGSSWTTRQHPVTRLLGSSLQSLLTLEEIMIELTDNSWKIWFLILNCPRLRRVALKGRVIFDAKLGLREWENNHLDSAGMQSPRPPELQLLSRAAVGKVQELFLYRSHRVEWGLPPKIFPGLAKLVTVFADSGWRDDFWPDLCSLKEPGRSPIELGQVIAQHKISLRSLTLTDILSVSEWTTREQRWYDNRLGHRAPIPPLLSPGLPQVPLVELMTDCFWLFGRDDPSITHQISSLLPSSLASLHLIDYWAVSVGEEGMDLYCLPGAVMDEVQAGPKGRSKTLGYYPVFPSGLTPLGFLDNVFAELYDSCAYQHSRLKNITLSSPMFDEEGRWSLTTVRPVDRAEVQAWQAKVGDTFAKIGVRFCFTTMRALEKSIKSSWAYM